MNFILDLHYDGSDSSLSLETVNHVQANTVPYEHVSFIDSWNTFSADIALIEPVSTDTVPTDTVPKDTAPTDTVPVDTVPTDTVPKDTAPTDTVPVDTVPVAFIPLRGNPIEEDRCPKLHEITREHYGLPGLREANRVLKNLYAGATSDRSHKDIYGVPITKRSFESIGITRFISLQEEHEEHNHVDGDVDHYGYPVDRCPVRDMSVTGDDEMLACAQDVFNHMAQGEVIYIHCRAGLGRTGVIVCIVLALKFGIDANRALLLCQKMKDCRCFKTPHKSPQTKAQVDQVRRIISRINSHQICS